jgi:beta-lactamase regulating signal transducer with metallopeptidase domain/Tol biopolymer transport system component
MGTLGVPMQPLFHWLLRSTVQASLIVCLILLLQAVFRNKLGVRWHHALWLILVVRMMLPWTPQSRLSVFNVVTWWDQPNESHSSLTEPSSRPPATSSTESSGNQPTGSGVAANSDQQPKNIDRVPQGSQKSDGSAMHPAHRTRDVLPLVWVVGAMALGAYVVVSNVKLWRATSIEHPSTDKDVLELLEECRARMGLRTIVALVASEKVSTPVLLGFIRPRLLIPRDIAKQLNHEELRYVFLHELAHVKRHDIALAWLTALLQVLHWFNPLVWLAFHRMRCDRELACDALVLTRTRGEGTKDYGRAIVSLLERFSFPPPLPGLAGILENRSQLKKRIAMITQFKNNSYRWSPLAVALIVTLACASLPDARSGKAAQPSAAKPTGASVASEQPPATPAGESNVFVDPQTGIRFTKFKTISGPSDVIDSSPDLNLSPNRKFLLWEVRVVPLDGSTPFDLVNIPNAGCGSWSPDGRKVVFYAGAMWLIEVDPETGRPAGSAKKLLEGEYSMGRWGVRWSLDSQRIVFVRWDSQVRGRIWTLSIESGELSQGADPLSFGIISPDGKMVACSDAYGIMPGRQDSLRVKPVTGGDVTRVLDGIYPVVWSADSEWLVCKPKVGGGWEDRIRFLRIADVREVEVSPPGYLIRRSPQGRKLLFYRGSYDYRNVLRVVSVTGGPPAELGSPSISFGSFIAGYLLWTPDSRSILVGGEQEGSSRGRGLWTVPLDGKNPQPLVTDSPVCRQADLLVPSPDGSKLLLVVWGEDRTADLWVVPISLSEMQSTGPAVKVFSGMVPPTRLWSIYLDAWSPDSSKIAFIHKRDVWVASADGKSSSQLTQTSEQAGGSNLRPDGQSVLLGNWWPDWSPDGTMIAFCSYSQAKGAIYVVPASGAEARVVTGFSGKGQRSYAWSPDGKELTIASENEGVISNFPISGGEAKTVLRVKNLGISRVGWLRWSPDGRLLAFQASVGQKQTLYTYQPDSAKPDRLADSNGEIGPWYWSPDSKWISFFSMETVKTRPEGVLWEMDVEKALAKLAK